MVFREVPNSNGALDGQNFEYGRIVADATKGFVQSNGTSGDTDIPVLVPASLTRLTSSSTGIKWGDTTDLPGAVCGEAGTISASVQAV